MVCGQDLFSAAGLPLRASVGFLVYPALQQERGGPQGTGKTVRGLLLRAGSWGGSSFSDDFFWWGGGH